MIRVIFNSFVLGDSLSRPAQTKYSEGVNKKKAPLTVKEGASIYFNMKSNADWLAAKKDVVIMPEFLHLGNLCAVGGAQ